VHWAQEHKSNRPQFTGDGAGRDHEGYYWIRGRVDDVVNVSGHRLSTAEIEAALIEHRKNTLIKNPGDIHTCKAN
jgi:acyl-coenzyme A synthetase/AMP-(fatty) acid ligase